MTNARIKKIVDAVYQSRKIRLSNPEGEFIGKSWFPHAREQGDDAMGTVKEPNDGSRYSYQIHCRSKTHVRHLVARGLAGEDVPADVRAQLDLAARETVRASVKPSTKIEGISRHDLPRLMEEFAKFLASQDVISTKRVDETKRY